jgi:hypothetical protein
MTMCSCGRAFEQAHTQCDAAALGEFDRIGKQIGEGIAAKADRHLLMEVPRAARRLRHVALLLLSKV